MRMTSNLNRDYQTPDIVQRLYDSERRYFLAGAHNRAVCGGTLSVVPGLQHLPAGCVFHSVMTPPRPGDLVSWLRALENRFMRVGSRLCRFYLQAGADDLSEGLTRLGYGATHEAGYARRFEGDCSDVVPHLSLRPLDPARDWTQKIQLCIQAGLGPDGYDMRHGAYATLERAKCQAGYMRSFLYWMGDRAVGAASIAIHDGFARLKNMLVHPEYRGRGIGREIVVGMMAEARRQGACIFGVFGATPASRRVYERCGLEHKTSQVEWSRAL
jgi:GNAT superfamily N-acetyltransferase